MEGRIRSNELIQSHKGKEYAGWGWDNEKYMAKNFPNKIEKYGYTDIGSSVCEARQIKKAYITFYNVVRLQISKDRALLKKAIEKTRIIPTKEQLLDWQWTSHQQQLKPGDWNNIFKILRENHFQHKIEYSAKVTSKHKNETLFS